MIRSRAVVLGVCVALVALVVVPYARVRGFGFVNFDDPGYVQQNPRVQQGLTWDNVVWAFTHARMSNWHPLTWMSHMLDVDLFGLDAGGHHLTSVVLHALNGVLLFLALRLMTGSLWRSAVVAALFAVHPLRVESVAWVSERKDVLAGLFFMLTLVAYAWHARRPGVDRFALVILALALGLMAKPMLITMPFLLLLLDAWPLRRWRVGSRNESPEGDGSPEAVDPLACPPRPLSALLLEKLPLLALAAGAAWLAVWAHADVAATSGVIPLSNRIANVPLGYVGYLRRIFWPTDLAFFYPLPSGFTEGVLQPWLVRGAWAGALLVLVTAVVSWCALGRLRRHSLLVGWLWFLGMLVPVIGLVQAGTQALADRYTYLPGIGVLIMVVWGVHDLTARVPGRALVRGAAAVLAVGLLLPVTWEQVMTWRSSFRLYDNAVRVVDDNFLAHNNLAIVFKKRGDPGLARSHFEEAIRIEPLFVQAHIGLGELLAEEGDPAGAERSLRHAVELVPGSFDARFGLARLLAGRGEHREAVEHLEQAHRARPASAACLSLLGTTKVALGDVAAGIEHLKRAVAIDPELESARENLRRARSLRRTGG